MKIGVIIAMDIEYRKMLDAIGGNALGKVGDNDVVLWQCGIGKVNAAVGTMKLMQQYNPDCIISTGLAGGLDTALQVMDVVVGRQTAYHDVWCGMGCERGQVMGLPVRFDADERMVSATRNIGGNRVLEGLICTGDQFITDHSELAKIKDIYPDALACDMESAAIAHTCRLMGVPFMSLRVISDTPGNTPDHQQQWDDFLGSMTDRSFHFVYNYLQQLPSTLFSNK